MVVFSWGWTGFGQSGTGLPGSGVDQGITSPTHTKLPPQIDQLISIAAGNFHSACVDIKGNLYTWGNARHGECGHFNKSGTLGPENEEELIPRQLKFKKLKFKMVACGMYHTLAITTSKQVYTWGSNALGQLGLGKYGPLSTTRPIKIDALDAAHIFTVAAGDSFSVALGLRTRQNNDFSNEDNDISFISENGASSSSASSSQKMTEIDTLKDDINKDGCLIFTWGENNKGQLGRDTNGQSYDKFVGHVKIDVASLTQVNDKDDVKTKEAEENNALLKSHQPPQDKKEAEIITMVYMAACGAEHMLLLTTKGIVYSCGSNSDGQLGIGSLKDAPTPKPIHEFVGKGLVVKKIIASGNVSGALAYSFNKFAMSSSDDNGSNSADVFMWGSNAEGQLGDGGAKIARRNIPATCYVEGQYNVIDLALGEEHAVALCLDRVLSTFSRITKIKNSRGNTTLAHDDNAAAAAANNNNKKSKSKKSVEPNEVVGHIVVWGRSAGGRLGVGNVEDFQSHLVHGAGNMKNTSSSSKTKENGATGGSGGGGSSQHNEKVPEVAFYRSISAVFLDDSLNFHTPVSAPFNPFLDNSDFMKDYEEPQEEEEEEEEEEEDDEDGKHNQVEKIIKIPGDKLTLKGIVAGGAHTFVYGSLQTTKVVNESKFNTKNNMKNKFMLSSYMNEDDDDDFNDGIENPDIDSNQEEFPESYSAKSLGVSSGNGGGWKQWKVCPRIGCNICLPDELADWHEMLCKKPYHINEEKEEENDNEIELGKNNEVNNIIKNSMKPKNGDSKSLRNMKKNTNESILKEDEMSYQIQSNIISPIKQLPPVSPSPSSKTILSPVNTQTVKKRIGGGFAYVTVPMTSSPSK